MPGRPGNGRPAQKREHVTPEPDPRVNKSSEGRLPNQHHRTPTKAALQGTVSYLRSEGLPIIKTRIYKHFGINCARTGRNILRAPLEEDQPTPRRLHNQPLVIEPRGRKLALGSDQIRRVENILQNTGYEGRQLNWDALVTEAELSITGRTLRSYMHTLDYWRCSSCQRNWIKPELAERYKIRAQNMLAERPEPEDWENVRFSDEVHGGFGPQGKRLVTRKPSEYHCSDCIQYKTPAKTKDEKKVHVWAAVGYNFCSNLVFYKVPGNTNGKMSQEVYIQSILEPVVKPWIDRGDDFVLWEDNDSGHGTTERSIAQIWKRRNACKAQFNIPSHPDLNIIENCWRWPKTRLKQHAHYSEEDITELMIEGWEEMRSEHQDKVNDWIHEMPRRLEAVIDAGGQMSAY